MQSLPFWFPFKGFEPAAQPVPLPFGCCPKLGVDCADTPNSTGGHSLAWVPRQKTPLARVFCPTLFWGRQPAGSKFFVTTQMYLQRPCFLWSDNTKPELGVVQRFNWCLWSYSAAEGLRGYTKEVGSPLLPTSRTGSEFVGQSVGSVAILSLFLPPVRVPLVPLEPLVPVPVVPLVPVLGVPGVLGVLGLLGYQGY